MHTQTKLYLCNQVRGKKIKLGKCTLESGPFTDSRPHIVHVLTLNPWQVFMAASVAFGFYDHVTFHHVYLAYSQVRFSSYRKNGFSFFTVTRENWQFSINVSISRAATVKSVQSWEEEGFPPPFLAKLVSLDSCNIIFFFFHICSCLFKRKKPCLSQNQIKLSVL